VVEVVQAVNLSTPAGLISLDPETVTPSPCKDHNSTTGTGSQRAPEAKKSPTEAGQILFVYFVTLGSQQRQEAQKADRGQKKNKNGSDSRNGDGSQDQNGSNSRQKAANRCKVNFHTGIF
jgi:hypothetical protein